MASRGASCAVKGRSSRDPETGYIPPQPGHRGIRKLVTFPHNPVACNSQTQTTTTTKTFRIVLILEAMGMYRLIRYNATPTIINTTTRFSKGIFLLLQSRMVQSVAQCSGGE